MFHYILVSEVIFRHGDNLVRNNTIVSLEEIVGGGSDLFCLTNTTTCCRNVADNSGMGAAGWWYYPNGSLVPGSAAVFSRNRGRSFVALTYSGPGPSPSGLYRCVIPDSRNQNVTAYVGVYQNGQGRLMSCLYNYYYCP